MEWTVHQHITIHKLEVGSVANSSILQIGSAGMIRGLSQLYNSGSFAAPAPELSAPSPFLFPLPGEAGAAETDEGAGPLVPLPQPVTE